MHELARMRSQSMRLRREANRKRSEDTALIDELQMVRGMGEITA